MWRYCFYVAQYTILSYINPFSIPLIAYVNQSNTMIPPCIASTGRRNIKSEEKEQYLANIQRVLSSIGIVLPIVIISRIHTEGVVVILVRLIRIWARGVVLKKKWVDCHFLRWWPFRFSMSEVANLFIREGCLVFFKHVAGRPIILSSLNMGRASTLNRIPNSKIHHYLLVYLYR